MGIKLILNKFQYFERETSFKIIYLNKYYIEENFHFKGIEYINLSISYNIISEYTFIYKYNHLNKQHKSYDYYNSEYITFKDKIDFLWK
jgi:hypothetical protein